MGDDFISFNPEDAILFGDKCALMITYIRFCINQHKIKSENKINGRTWMVQSIDQIAENFPLGWSREKTGRVIKKLVDFGVIVKGNFNNHPFDRTSWYAFNDERYLIEK